jgi:hypothetical protein
MQQQQPQPFRRNSVSSLGSFIQHEVDFSCSVCARRRNSFIAFENRSVSVEISPLPLPLLPSAFMMSQDYRNGIQGVENECKDISGFTGVSTTELSSVLNGSIDEKGIIMVEGEDSNVYVDIAKTRRLFEIESAKSRQEREKYIMDAILVAKIADSRRPSKRLLSLPSIIQSSPYVDVLNKRKILPSRKKREEAQTEGKEELLTLTIIERRLEVLRKEEERIQMRVLRQNKK